jgi:triacylglycerol esterase/lipase EstA (alpha/beta hydrolase family)
MYRLADSLEKAGFFTVNYHYPSTKASVEALAEEEIPKALGLCPKDSTIHFVTHSMGGIILRQYLSKNKVDKLGRVVMLGPPNQGSQVVDRLKGFPGFKLINGPAGMQLGTQKTNLPKRLPPVDFELGVIAGSRSINLILSLMLPWPNDGKVSVENTKVEGMSDHIVLPVTHPFMMRNKRVIEQVITFLKQGAFNKQNI